VTQLKRREISTGLNAIQSNKTAVFIHRHIPIAKSANKWAEAGASLFH